MKPTKDEPSTARTANGHDLERHERRMRPIAEPRGRRKERPETVWSLGVENAPPEAIRNEAARITCEGKVPAGDLSHRLQMWGEPSEINDPYEAARIIREDRVPTGELRELLLAYGE